MALENVYTYSTAQPGDISRMHFYGLEMSNLEITENWLKMQKRRIKKTLPAKTFVATSNLRAFALI